LREDVLQGGAHEEVLLLEAQLLALRGRIVRIQHAREILRVDLVLNGAVIVTCVERIDLERRDRTSRPQSQMVDGRAAVAWTQEVEGNRPDIVRIDPLVADAPILTARCLTMSAETNAVPDTGAAALPEVPYSQPRARHFALCAVFADDLREDPVVVANAVAGRRIAERCQRIEEAGSEPA